MAGLVTHVTNIARRSALSWPPLSRSLRVSHPRTPPHTLSQGTEKVILIQEQLSKNRIIIDTDQHGEVRCGDDGCTHGHAARGRAIRVSCSVCVCCVVASAACRDQAFGTLACPPAHSPPPPGGL